MVGIRSDRNKEHKHSKRKKMGFNGEKIRAALAAPGGFKNRYSDNGRQTA